jgi:hypothetical protein
MLGRRKNTEKKERVIRTAPAPKKSVDHAASSALANLAMMEMEMRSRLRSDKSITYILVSGIQNTVYGKPESLAHPSPVRFLSYIRRIAIPSYRYYASPSPKPL